MASHARRLPMPELMPATARPLDVSLARRDASGVICQACARRCKLGNEQVGFCSAIVNWNGTLYSTAFGVVAEASETPIESKPVFHYRPGTMVLSLGGLGCNLRCSFCQNWEVAFRDARRAGGLAAPNLPPDEAVALALARGCAGVGWTFNEPSISPIYTRECAQRARAAGLYTVFSTNGLLTREALDFLGPWLDVYRVDVKSIEPAFYQRIGATDRIAEMLPIARRAKVEFGSHVEVVTNLMPGFNDGEAHLARLAGRLVELLGEETPWHVTSFAPYAFMRDVPPTPPEALARAHAIGRQAGLRFVYTDSLSAPETANTFCPHCGALAIERIRSHVIPRAVAGDGTCANCHAALGIITASAGASVGSVRN